MQALILAAGMGKRLGKPAGNYAKCMITVDEKTLIERSITSIRDAGVTKIIIVVGYSANVLIDHVSSIEGIELEFIFNRDYETTNNIYSLYLAKNVLLRDDTLLLESDLIFDPTLIHRMIASENSAALVDKYSSWMDGTTVLIDKEDNITRFIEKTELTPDLMKNCYKTVNIYKFTKEFSSDYYVPKITKYVEEKDKNSYYEIILKILMNSPHSIFKAIIVQNKLWYEIDNSNDLSIAKKMFSSTQTKE